MSNYVEDNDIDSLDKKKQDYTNLDDLEQDESGNDSDSVVDDIDDDDDDDDDDYAIDEVDDDDVIIVDNKDDDDDDDDITAIFSVNSMDKKEDNDDENESKERVGKYRKSLPILYNFEKAGIFSIRMAQLERGAQSTIELDKLNCKITINAIVNEEFKQSKIPIKIKRNFPDGFYEFWYLKELN